MRMQREILEPLQTVLYLVLLISQIICLVRIIRKGQHDKQRSSFIRLMLVEAVCIVLSLFLSLYYDSLPGYGFMPGFTWLYLWIISFAMIFVFLLMLLITAIAFLIQEHKARRSNRKHSD